MDELACFSEASRQPAFFNFDAYAPWSSIRTPSSFEAAGGRSTAAPFRGGSGNQDNVTAATTAFAKQAVRFCCLGEREAARNLEVKGASLRQRRQA